MWRARPMTTVSVTLTSGCRDVPDFSAYFLAYAHILSMLACDGCFIRSPCRIDRRQALTRLRQPRQRRLDGLRVETGELLLPDEEHGQREQSQRDQFLPRLGIPPHVLFGEFDALLR